MQEQLSNMRLFHLISPALPIGAFAYSQGMEWCVESGWVKNSNDVVDWINSLVQNSLSSLDLPILLRLYDACEKKDRAAFFYWSQYLHASRETNELRQEESNRARALLMILSKLPDASSWPEVAEWRNAVLQVQAAGFALAAQRWGISRQSMLAGYAWSWLENSVSIAIKLIPLGQTDGQTVLHHLSALLPAAIDRAMTLDDDDIGASAPAQAIASSQHETQYSRLFRS